MDASLVSISNFKAWDPHPPEKAQEKWSLGFITMQWMIVQIDKNTLKQLAKELNNFMPGNVWLKIE